MSIHQMNSLPTTARLLKATGAAIAAAAGLLVTTVLPAEYGIDPTGIGAKLGLLSPATTAQAAPAPIVVEAAASAPGQADPQAAALAGRAAAVFGVQPGQTFDVRAVARSASAVRTDTMAVTLEPGKGAEIKALLQAGEGFIFQWTASAEVAFDMHGERPEAKDEYTSYWIEAAQRDGAGSFTAPFAGQHGWYWLNRGKEPVTVQVSVTGFQQKLFRPGHP